VEIAKEQSGHNYHKRRLGPTCDDLTKQTLAECFGSPLCSTRRRRVKYADIHNAGNMSMPENNLSQALLPQAAQCFTITRHSPRAVLFTPKAGMF
jgi:nicotinamide-nucleotide amidase